LLRVDDIEQGHKQYERYQFLLNQYKTVYKDYIAGKIPEEDSKE
jgi:hypothetical protein